MAIRVTPYVWDEDLQMLREIPLDDADPWTIQMARAIAGRSLMDEELNALLRDNARSLSWPDAS